MPETMIVSESRPVRAGTRLILTGGGLGLAWGVTMRAWMRFISERPEFSWSGTLFIVGAATIVGSLLGFARYRRQQNGVGWWRSNALSLMLLGAGGSVMWPSVLLGAAAVGRPSPRWFRILAGVSAAAYQMPVVADAILENFRLSAADKVIAVAWYVPLLVFEIWAFSVVFSPSLPGAPIPGPMKRILIGIPIGAMVLMAGVLTGLPGM